MKDKRRDLRSYRAKVAQAKARALKSDTPTLCWLCKRPIDMSLPYQDRWAFTLDHVEALANGGHITGTLLPAHRACNSARGKGDKQNPIQGATRDW